MTPEQVCFPAAAQAGQLWRKLGAGKGQVVWVLTSREPQRLNAQQWLAAQRAYWGIEAGLHQSLDVTALEDLCRVRTPRSVWVLGMFRRIAVSLFQEWKSRDPGRRWATLTDFYGEMSAESHRSGLQLITSRRPNLDRRLHE